MLTVTDVNLSHTCTVKDFYDVYPSVRCKMPDAHTRSTVDAMLGCEFNVRATDIAMYLREHGFSNITLKDIANWRQKIRAADGPKNEMQVKGLVTVLKYTKRFRLYV